MPKRYQSSIAFQGVKRRKVVADFSGGDVTDNAGLLLLAEVDREMGLTQAVARGFRDVRRKASCVHSVLSMFRQRVYGLALGYEDLNDHDKLRHDTALQTAVSEVEPLASSPVAHRAVNGGRTGCG